MGLAEPASLRERSIELRLDDQALAKAIEQIDLHIVKPIAEYLASVPEHRILVCPDHPTFITTKTHSRGPVPFVMAGSGINQSGQKTYDEIAASASGVSILPGWTLMGTFLRSN
jgi:2,3-bisphosphoglycerate-independent phosphoglycerate mutase